MITRLSELAVAFQEIAREAAEGVINKHEAYIQLRALSGVLGVAALCFDHAHRTARLQSGSDVLPDVRFGFAEGGTAAAAIDTPPPPAKVAAIAQKATLRSQAAAAKAARR